MIGIYKITNLVNSKMYIGQSKDIEKRWREHKNIAFSSNKANKEYEYPIYRAMRKYGIDNFKFEILIEIEEELLDLMEIYYIKKFNTYIHADNSNGYNQITGGGRTRGENNPMYGKQHSEETKRKISENHADFSNGNHPQAKKVVCENKVFNSLKECANYYGIMRQLMGQWLLGKSGMPQEFIDKGLHYEGENKEYRKRSRTLKKKVFCEETIFDSLKECAIYYGKSYSIMFNWLSGRTSIPQEFVEKGLRYL